MNRAWTLPGLVLLAALLAGCDRATASRPGAAAVLATVNGVEISARETAGIQALEKIIDRELLVQKALEAGLERDPLVLQSIDDARRQVLAQAYLERAATPAAKATPEEIRGFYADNPALFGERRIYRLRELAVSAPEEMLDVLRSEAARAKDLEELAAWLRRRGARFSPISLTQPAEQLPLSQLPQLARMTPGYIAVFATPPGARSWRRPISSAPRRRLPRLRRRRSAASMRTTRPFSASGASTACASSPCRRPRRCSTCCARKPLVPRTWTSSPPGCAGAGRASARSA